MKQKYFLSNLIILGIHLLLFLYVSEALVAGFVLGNVILKTLTLISYTYLVSLRITNDKKVDYLLKELLNRLASLIKEYQTTYYYLVFNLTKAIFILGYFSEAIFITFFITEIIIAYFLFKNYSKENKK